MTPQEIKEAISDDRFAKGLVYIHKLASFLAELVERVEKLENTPNNCPIHGLYYKEPCASCAAMCKCE
jgi:hypothetical protein